MNSADKYKDLTREQLIHVLVKAEKDLQNALIESTKKWKLLQDRLDELNKQLTIIIGERGL